MDRITLLPELKKRCGLGRATIYRYWADPTSNFPRRRRVGLKRVGVLESELNAWLANLPAENAGMEVQS